MSDNQKWRQVSSGLMPSFRFFMLLFALFGLFKSTEAEDTLTLIVFGGISLFFWVFYILMGRLYLIYFKTDKVLIKKLGVKKYYSIEDIIELKQAMDTLNIVGLHLVLYSIIIEDNGNSKKYMFLIKDEKPINELIKKTRVHNPDFKLTLKDSQ